MIQINEVSLYLYTNTVYLSVYILHTDLANKIKIRIKEVRSLYGLF